MGISCPVYFSECVSIGWSFVVLEFNGTQRSSDIRISRPVYFNGRVGGPHGDGLTL